MSLEYVEWLIPDAIEGFYAVCENGKRRLRWPGLGLAVWTLLLEVMCSLYAFFTMILMTFIFGYRLVMGHLHDTSIPELPTSSGSKRGERFQVITLDASKGQVTPEIIQEFMARTEPVIIKNLPKKTFSALATGGQYAPPLSESMLKKGKAVVNFYFIPRALGEMGQWIEKHIQLSTFHVVRFSGLYKSGPAHLDGSSFNIYYLAKGRKRVWICPRQYNHLLKFESGFNSTFIPGSDGEDCISWMEAVPGVWELNLEAGDVMLSNNSACVHKFQNVAESPEAFSCSVLVNDMSPVLAWHHCFNWEQSRFYSKMQISKLWGNANWKTQDGIDSLIKSNSQCDSGETNNGLCY